MTACDPLRSEAPRPPGRSGLGSLRTVRRDASGGGSVPIAEVRRHPGFLGADIHLDPTDPETGPSLTGGTGPVADLRRPWVF